MLATVGSIILSSHTSWAIFRPPSAAGSYDFVFEQVQPHINNVIEKTRDLATDEAVLQAMDVCGGFQLIEDQIPNGKESCICRDSQVHCTLQGSCSEDRTVCTDVVGMSFQFLVENEKVSRMKLSACFMYTEEFEPTCIETLIGHGQTLEKCNSATYGGKACMCAICGDNKSLSLDCTKHHPAATSSGCYLLSDALPSLSKFDEPSQRPQSRRTTEETSSSSGAPMNGTMYRFILGVLLAITTAALV